jgi:hypothetical protein
VHIKIEGESEGEAG